MAEHKAPTEVTIVSQDDRSGFALFVERHWMKAALVAVAIAGSILFNQYRQSADAAAEDKSWEDLMASVEEDQRGVLTGDPEAIEASLPSLEGKPAGAWALFFLASSLREQRNYDEAIATLARIKAEHPEHPLAKDSRTYGESVTPLTQIEYLTKVFSSEKKWRAENPGIFENPAIAAGSPRATIQTDHGDIVVILDVARAPEHVANFTKLVSEGFYNGLKVHRSIYGQRIEMGDPTTRDPESNSMLWGQKGNDENIAKEDSGLSHFAGALSAMEAPGTDESSGSLIALLAVPFHGFDGKNVVFGSIVEGLDVLKDITVLPADPTGQRAAEPVTIQSVTIAPGA